MIGVLITRGHLETDTQGECCVKAEIWVMLLEGEESQSLQQAAGSQGKGLGRLFLTALRRHQP